MVGARDLVEIAILTVFIYFILRFLGKTRGSGVMRGLGLIVVGLFLVAQVVIASFDLTELSRVLDYLLTTVLVGLVVIFQPELRRGLTVLGRYRMLRYFVGDHHHGRRVGGASEAVLGDPLEIRKRQCSHPIEKASGSFDVSTNGLRLCTRHSRLHEERSNAQRLR